MFTGKSGDKFQRKPKSTAQNLLPTRHIEVSLENSQVQQFADWLDEQLAALVVENSSFATTKSNRQYFDRI